MDKGFNIKKVIGHNFQSHKHNEVEFSSGLTVITGETDQGKTSFFERLIYWVLTNNLSGDFFVRNNDEGKVNADGELLKEDTCYGTIIFENGIVLTRKKIKTKNIYELTDQNGELFEFENFGKTIPEPITNLIPISKIIVDKDLSITPNFPPTKGEGILSKSNVEKTKIIGSLAGTNVLDAAIRITQADIKNLSTEENALKKDIEQMEDKIKTFGDMERQKQLIISGDQINQDIKNCSENLIKVNELSNSLLKRKELNEELNNVIKFKSFYEEHSKYINRLGEKVIEIQNFYNSYIKIKNIYEKLKVQEANLEENNKIIATKNEVLEKENKLKNLELKVENLKLTSSNTLIKVEMTNNLIKKKERLENSIKELDKIILGKDLLVRKEEKVNKLETIVLNLKDTYTSLKYLKGIQESIKTKVELVNKLSTVISSKKSISLKETKLNNKEKKIKDIEKEILELQNTLNNVTNIKKHLDEKIAKEVKGVPILNKMKEDLEKAIENCISNIEKLGKCPVCYSDLTPEHMANIKNELLA